MASLRIYNLAAVLLIWMAVVVFIMMVARMINVEIFFVLWLIVALILVELFSLQTVRPKWKKVQAMILGCSLAVFAAIIVMKIIEILMEV